MNANLKSAGHLNPLLIPSRRKAILNLALSTIKENNLYPTGVVGSGLSGVMFATLLADKLKIPPVLVRKRGETYHSFYEVEGLNQTEANHLLIVDDFADTGETIRYIKQTIKDFTQEHGLKYKILPIGLFYDTEPGVKRFIYEGIKFKGVYVNK